MKKAAVIIEKWKLPIFTRHLREAGYTYDTFPGITDDTLNLQVEYEWVAKLAPIVQAAQNECARDPRYTPRK